MIGMSNDDDFRNETGMQKLNIMNFQALSIHFNNHRCIFHFCTSRVSNESSLCTPSTRILFERASVQASRTKSKRQRLFIFYFFYHANIRY